MANIDNAFGLMPSRYLNGAPYNGQAHAYYVPDTDSTALFIGDPVAFAGSSNDTKIAGFGIGTLATVVRATGGAASTQAILGPIVAVDPLIGEGIANAGTAGRDATIYRQASSGRVVWVADDPQIVFEVQSDGTTVIEDIGLNCQYIIGTGSTITGISGGELDDSEAAVTLTDMLKILGVTKREDNELGEFNVLDVLINQHQFRTGVVGL